MPQYEITDTRLIVNLFSFLYTTNIYYTSLFWIMVTIRIMGLWSTHAFAFQLPVDRFWLSYCPFYWVDISLIASCRFVLSVSSSVCVMCKWSKGISDLVKDRGSSIGLRPLIIDTINPLTSLNFVVFWQCMGHNRRLVE